MEHQTIVSQNYGRSVDYQWTLDSATAANEETNTRYQEHKRNLIRTIRTRSRIPDWFWINVSEIIVRAHIVYRPSASLLQSPFMSKASHARSISSVERVAAPGAHAS